MGAEVKEILIYNFPNYIVEKELEKDLVTLDGIAILRFDKEVNYKYESLYKTNRNNRYK